MSYYEDKIDRLYNRNMKNSVHVLVGKEKIQHVVSDRDGPAMRERIKRAYNGRATIYKVNYTPIESESLYR